MNRNIRQAVVMALVVALWFSSALWWPDDPAPAVDASPQAGLTQIQARWYQRQPHYPVYTVSATTQPNRRVDIKAQAAGMISKVAVLRGATVAAGDLICMLDDQGRRAALRAAQAAVERADLEHRGVVSLKRGGFQSDLAIARALAELQAARSVLAVARNTVDHLRMVAPFAGIVEERALELGDYVRPGQLCATLVELDPLRVVTQVAAANINQLRIGQSAQFGLSSGDKYPAIITYLAHTADTTTRTYRVEAQVANPTQALRAGLAGELEVALPSVAAQLIPAAVLQLDDAGRSMVKVLAEDDRVVNINVQIISGNASGVWVQGLPPRVALITVGQNYVIAGERVDAVFSDPLER